MIQPFSSDMAVLPKGKPVYKNTLYYTMPQGRRKGKVLHERKKAKLFSLVCGSAGDTGPAPTLEYE